MKRLLITGSRTWTNQSVIRAALTDAWHELGGGEVMLVSGAAKGADRMCEHVWREVLGLPVERHPVIWKPYGILNPQAGFARNLEMIQSGADLCIAFIKNNSNGASHCARYARLNGIPTEIWRENGAGEIFREERREVSTDEDEASEAGAG